MQITFNNFPLVFCHKDTILKPDE